VTVLCLVVGSIVGLNVVETAKNLKLCATLTTYTMPYCRRIVDRSGNAGAQNLTTKINVFRLMVALYIYTVRQSEYISDIYVDGLCIISVKLNFETRRDFVRLTYLLKRK